jgi:hypothetical protein
VICLLLDRSWNLRNRDQDQEQAAKQRVLDGRVLVFPPIQQCCNNAEFLKQLKFLLRSLQKSDATLLDSYVYVLLLPLPFMDLSVV